MREPAHPPSDPRSIRLRPPPRREDYLQRRRLLDVLHANIQRKLILVAAAAGYGKTSLLADFALDTDYPVAWLRLVERDRDVAVLAGEVATALRGPYPGLEVGVEQLAGQAGAGPEALARALSGAIERGVGEYFVLVLDDVHELEGSAAALGFLDALLEHMPEQAHVVAAGRSIPALRLTRLVARGEVAGLSEEHLRFTAEEVGALLKLRHNVALPAGEAEKLIEGTDGWVTGILLTSELMWQGLVGRVLRAGAGASPVYEYLAAEVLEQQAEPLRTFLVESAVLPEMDGAACDAVLGRGDSRGLLEQAEARRLFVSGVGEEPRTYQYHQLFREFLVARLGAADGGRLRALRVKAAEWYGEQGLPELAVTYYVQAGEQARAAEIVEARAREYFEKGRYETLRRWREQLGEAAGDAPTLFMSLARVEMDASRWEAAESLLAAAEAGYVRKGDRAGELRVALQRAWILYQHGRFNEALAIAEPIVDESRVTGDGALTALATRYAGLSNRALGRNQVAEQLLDESAKHYGAGKREYDLGLILQELAQTQRALGRTAAAAQSQQRALTIWRKLAAPSQLASALNNVGWDFHMLGQYEPALAIYREGVEWARQAGDRRNEALLIVGQADLWADLAAAELASRLYHEALELLANIDDLGLRAYTYRALARLDRRSGNRTGALEWLQRADLAGTGLQQYSSLSSTEALRAILRAETDSFRYGRAKLIPICDDLAQKGSLVELAQALLYRAVAEFRCGDANTSMLTLKQSLDLARRVGYDQMLLSEVWSARDLLEAGLQRPDLRPHCQSLLNRADALPAIRARLEKPESEPTPAPAAPLDVHALGHGRLVKDGREVEPGEWQTQRTKELFFYLVDRSPVVRDVLLEAFWPDKPVARASANLYQTLYRLRRVVGAEVVEFEGQVCRLKPDIELSYDVKRFEEQARAALAYSTRDLRRLQALADAVRLYPGEYLADLAVDWALERRRGLSELHIRLLLAYADELMNLTRYAEARDVLRRALAAEPLRDDLHQRMLLCLAEQKRRDEIVMYYQQYCETLRRELAADPPPEIRALYARLIE